MPTNLDNTSDTQLRSVVEHLQQEHQEGADHLKELSEAARSIQKNGFTVSAFEQIARSIRWLNTSVRRHMQHEEQQVFPLLMNDYQDLLKHLQVQHHELSTAFTQLMDTVYDVEEGTLRGSILQELVTTTDDVVRRLAEHMEEENTALFPLVINLLESKQSK